MGLATIDSHSQKEHIEIHKIPKFGVNQASFHWDTAIWKCQNLQRNVWNPDAVSDSVRIALQTALQTWHGYGNIMPRRIQVLFQFMPHRWVQE